MAAHLIPTVPNTPLLHTYNDDEHGRARLPNGACNFTNLSVGGNAPRCGCRRFWDQSAGAPVVAEVGGRGPRPGYCMCEHHACFHDHDPTASSRQPSAEVVGNVALSVPRAQRSSLSFKEQPGLERFQAGSLEEERRQGEENLPDTLQWNQFVHSGSHAGSLPPIPSQCLMPSQSSSVTGSAQARYVRPFGGLGLQTLSHIPTPNNAGVGAMNVDKGQHVEEQGRVMQQYEDSAGRVYVQSLTDVATTPRSRCSPEYDEAAMFESNIHGIQTSLEKLAKEKPIKADEYSVALRPNTERQTVFKKSQDTQAAPVGSYPDTDDEENFNLLPKIRSIVQHVSNYPITMQNHEARLDLLENASFCNAGIEDLQERHEHLDTRVGEIETRVNEIEKVQNDASSVGSRHNLEGSMVSHTSSVMDQAELDSTIEFLKVQIADLQSSALPSYRNPWEVEVVFLPYGKRLKGIWGSQQSMTQRSRTNSLRAEDWTQTQHNTMASAQAFLAVQDHIGTWEDVAMDNEDQQEWLMAKACGPRSRVDERLRSRGLVKSIQIKGPDARDFQAAMMSAFGDLPAWLAGVSSEQKLPPIHASFNKYLGLQAPWIPLRKIHKDSCLRFLGPSEMITPSLWSVTWLQSSVAMRAANKTRRLYVTQRDSYIQHQGKDIVDWTWQMLRELPRVYPDSQSSMEVPEADAQETCWEFDERLDPPPSLHSSFASQHSSLSIRSVRQEEEEHLSSPSDHFSSAAVSPAPSTTPTTMPPMRPISPLKERHPFRPVHIRTTSMPQLVPVKSSPPQNQGLSKRRIASFENETQSSPVKMSHFSNLKRRRISRSPSRPRDTPRWSVGPPSPFAYEELHPMERKRGTTPFAYATPHSNAPYVEPSRTVKEYDDDDDQGSTTDDLHQDEDYHLGMYDSESESDAGAGGHQPDEEWEGVQDEATEYESRQDCQGKSILLQGQGDMERDDGDDDDASDVSSQPSEYPSTQPQPPSIFVTSKGAAFKIHVDEEMFDEGV